jgi:hypothetical protein
MSALSGGLTLQLVITAYRNPDDLMTSWVGPRQIVG